MPVQHRKDLGMELEIVTSRLSPVEKEALASLVGELKQSGDDDIQSSMLHHLRDGFVITVPCASDNSQYTTSHRNAVDRNGAFHAS